MTSLPFVFSPTMDERDFGFIAQIPASIHDRDALFAELAQQLRFPDYFGKNWDALDECLQDLSWLEAKKILLAHTSSPQLPRKELGTYLAILHAAQTHHASEQRLFVVSFPEETHALREAWSA